VLGDNGLVFLAIKKGAFQARLYSLKLLFFMKTPQKLFPRGLTSGISA
jgi:hypothetical protein